jgi:hypothetical protein
MRSKSILLAYLLFVFLGPLGAHNFYLEKWIWGLVYLALFVFSCWAMLHVDPHLFQNAALSPAALLDDPSLRAAAFALSVLHVFIIWDFFTLWWQVRRYREDQ